MFVNLVFLIFGFLTCAFAEPSCSKFHYDEKLLEKIVRVEFEMENFRKEFTRMKEIWESKSSEQTLSETEQRQRQELDDLMIEVRRNVSKEMTTLTDEVRTPMISFRARDPSTLSPSTGSTIIYGTAEVNDGAGYNTGTGVFTAPVTGQYMFTVNICTKTNDEINISVVKDGIQIASTKLADKTYYYCSSLIAHAVLDKDNKVWIKCIEGGKLNDYIGYYWNMFSGVLNHT